jgi:hypothetical protein
MSHPTESPFEQIWEHREEIAYPKLFGTKVEVIVSYF